MRKVRNDEPWIAIMRQEYFSARSISAKEGAKLIDRYAAAHGMDRSSLFRKIKANICKRAATEEEIKNMQRINTYAADVFHFQQSKTREGARFHISKAYEVMMRQGKIPDDITRDQIYHSIQKQFFKTRTQPVAKRFERKHPLSLMQIDYTVSRYFKNAGDGRVVLADPKFTRKHTEEKERVIYAQALDDASRVIYGEFIFSPGESMELVHTFLLKAMEQKDRVIEDTGECIADKLLQGMPKCVYWDRLGAHESKVTCNWLESMGIKVAHGNEEYDAEGHPTGRSNKKAHGKAERNIQDHKESYEAIFWGAFEAGKSWTLEELNDELHAWLRRKNCGYHPTREGKRWEIFEPALAEAKYPAENALALTAGTFWRIVRNRLINVGKHRHCIAPVFIRDGKRVEILEEHGSYYLLHEGSRHLLQMQNEDMRQTERTELETDKLADIFLNERLAEELQEISDGTIRLKQVRMREDLSDDLAYFCEGERSIAEIKTFARQIVGTMNSIPAAKIIMAKIS